MRRTLPKIRAEVLREVERIAAAAAVRRPDVEKAEVGIAGGREGVEGELAPVVVAEGLLDPQQLARRAAVVGRRGGVGGRPLEQDRVVGVVAAPGHEVRRRRRVARIGVGVELAVPGRAGLGELRMEGEALEAALPARRLDGDRPRRGGQVEIRRDGPAIVADGVDEAVHVVDEQPPGARLVDEPHHARGAAAEVRQRRELDDADGDDAVGRGDGRRERIVARLGARDRGGQQHRPAAGPRRSLANVMAPPPLSCRRPAAPPRPRGRDALSRTSWPRLPLSFRRRCAARSSAGSPPEPGSRRTGPARCMRRPPRPPTARPLSRAAPCSRRR